MIFNDSWLVNMTLIIATLSGYKRCHHLVEVTMHLILLETFDCIELLIVTSKVWPSYPVISWLLLGARKVSHNPLFIDETWIPGSLIRCCRIIPIEDNVNGYCLDLVNPRL